MKNQPSNVDASLRMELQHAVWTRTQTTHAATVETDINLM